MNTSVIRALQQQAASVFFAALMTVAMLAGIGALATPDSSNAALFAASHLQAAGALA